MPTSSTSQGGTQIGPDWSCWPTRILGSAARTALERASATLHDRDGTHRLISPDDTWRALQPLLEPAGITRVADLTWLDDIGIPTVQAVRPGSLSLSVSQGKATTYRGAQVSAVMESMEGWHCENVTPDLYFTPARDMASMLTYDPTALSRPAGSLYHEGAKLNWMCATTLLTGRRTWVPWAAVVVNVGVGDQWGPPMFTMSTNGLASGNTYDEAALHGLYEVMERHSLSTARAGSTMFEVQLDDVARSNCAQLLDMVYAAGSELHIARIDTWDGFYCFTVELSSSMLQVPFSGSGLHHDPNVALSRAITEAAQSRLTAISGAREDLPSAIYHRFARLHSHAPAHRSMVAMPPAAPTPWGATGSNSLTGLLAAATTAVMARAANTEPLVVVCDFVDACVPVVRVIAPGLSSQTASPMRAPLGDAA